MKNQFNEQIGKKGEVQAARAAACAAPERQRLSDLPLLRGIQGPFLHLEEALRKEWLSRSSRSAAQATQHPVSHSTRDCFADPPLSHQVAFSENCNWREVVFVIVITPANGIAFPRGSIMARLSLGEVKFA